MRLNQPKKNTFWAAVILVAVGVVVYIVHLVVVYLLKMTVPFLQPIAFLLVVVGFVLLCLGLTMKGL
jgi:hypothetical protein